MQAKRNRLIFLIVYLAYTSIYIARVNLSMAGPDLNVEGIVTTAGLGLLGGIFSTVFAAGRLLNGTLSDRVPPYKMLTIGLALAGISNILVSFFPPFVGIFLLWMTNAYAQSMLWSSVLCVVSDMYDSRTAKKKTSLMVTSVAMGNIIGILLNTFLITEFGLRYAFLVPGILTIALGALTFFFTRHIRPTLDTQNVKKKHLSIFALIKNKEVLTMGIPAFLHGVMKDNVPLFMTVFVVDRYVIDLSKSSYYVLLVPAIGFIGRIIYPLVYRLCKEKENTVSVFGFVTCAVASLLLCFSSIPLILAVLCLGVIYTAASVINTSILSIYPLRYHQTGNVASVSGVMDFATYLGAGITGMLYGVCIENFGYTPMFFSWIVFAAVSVFFLFRVDRMRKAVSSDQ